MALTALVSALLLAACAEPQVRPSVQHLQPAEKPAGAPPALSTQLAPPKPKSAPKAETYSVVVNDIPVRDLLFALARDARIDIDIAADIDGRVTLNALDQTLPQLLERLARQVDLRWELRDKVLTISRDTPFLKNYRIDYVNLARETISTMNVATQVGGAAAGSSSSGGGSAGGQGGNSSAIAVTNTAHNKFWETLVQNVKDILRETDKVLPDGSMEETIQTSEQDAGTRTTTTPAGPGAATQTATQSARATTRQRSTFREAASVIANAETGIVAVRATARQHEKIQEFLDRILSSSRRQVLIEATIVEVSLNDQSQSGVDWKRLALGSGLTLRQNFLGNSLSQVTQLMPDTARVDYIQNIMANTDLTAVQKAGIVDQIAKGMGAYPAIDPGTGAVTIGDVGAGVPTVFPDTGFTGGSFPLTGDSRGMTVGFGNGANFAAAMKLLSQFGRLKVISSPKVTALNNQSAVLRVVDNLVYFTISGQTIATGNNISTTYTSTPNTVAVGFVMSVVPQIDEGNVVTLNVRPTISRLKGYARDPNPALSDIPNLVPIVQTREMESIMKVPSGNIVMMGGLMEDREVKDSEGVQGLGDLPGIGKLFSTRNSASGKTELVIFLRPIVITDPSLDGDYRFARDMLPGKDFFNQPVERPLPRLALPQEQTE